MSFLSIRKRGRKPEPASVEFQDRGRQPAFVITMTVIATIKILERESLGYVILSEGFSPDFLRSVTEPLDARLFNFIQSQLSEL